jgi:hypothetical protein
MIFLALSVCLLLPSKGRAEEDDEDDDSSLVQCQEKPTKKARAKKMASALFSRAERAFKEGKNTKALRRFLCSLYYFEHPATLTNIESVLDSVPNKELSLKILKDYVVLNPDGTLTPKIQTRIVELEIALGKLEKDEKKCEEKVAPPREPVCVSYPDATPCLNQAASQTRLNKLLSIGMIGLGAAAAVAGGVLQGFSIAKGNDADAADQFVYGGVSVERKQSEKLQVAAIAAFSSGVITAGLGIVQFLLNKKHGAAIERTRQHPAMVEKCERPQEEKSATETTDSAESSDDETPPPADKPPASDEKEEKTPPEVSLGAGAILIRFSL